MNKNGSKISLNKNKLYKNIFELLKKTEIVELQNQKKTAEFVIKFFFFFFGV